MDKGIALGIIAYVVAAIVAFAAYVTGIFTAIATHNLVLAIIFVAIPPASTIFGFGHWFGAW